MMKHKCDEKCVCHIHDDLPMLYSDLRQEHACQKPDCIYAHGYEAARYDPELMRSRTRTTKSREELDQAIFRANQILSGLYTLYPSLRENPVESPIAHRTPKDPPDPTKDRPRPRRTGVKPTPQD